MASRTYQQPKIVIVKNYTSNATGIASFVFGLISIFWLAPLFVPLAVLMGIIAIISRQFAWGLIGLLCAFIGFLTSPILMGILGITAIVANFPKQESHAPALVSSTQQQMQELEIRRENFVTESDKLLQKMQAMDLRVDNVSSKLPEIETKYHDITQKVGTYYNEAQGLPGNNNFVARNQLIVAMNQGPVATYQVNNQVLSLENDFRSSVMPLLQELAAMKQHCPGVDLRVQAACQKFNKVGDAFKVDSKSLAESLDKLDRTSQNELAAQQAMITKAGQIQ